MESLAKRRGSAGFATLNGDDDGDNLVQTAKQAGDRRPQHVGRWRQQVLLLGNTG